MREKEGDGGHIVVVVVSMSLSHRRGTLPCHHCKVGEEEREGGREGERGMSLLVSLVIVVVLVVVITCERGG